MRPIASLPACLALALCCGLAHAAPKDELHDAFVKFLQAKSFRATITDLNGRPQYLVEDNARPMPELV